MKGKWQRHVAKALYVLMILNLFVSFIVYPMFISMINSFDRQVVDELHGMQEILYMYDGRIVQTETMVEILSDNIAHPYVPAQTYTYQELNEMAHLVAREVGNDPYKAQLGVAQCVYDRLNCTTYNYGETIMDVIYAPNQFCTDYDWLDMNEFPRAMEAVIDVFYNGVRAWDQPVYYFYSSQSKNERAVRWFETLPFIEQVGDTIFRGM